MARRTRGKSGEEVLLIGLGRFGSALADTLTDLGHSVLGIDADADRVQAFARHVARTVEADATDSEVLEQLGAADFDHAVVAIGDDLEASILCTFALVDLGVRDIWAKANTESHGAILERVGAKHVVFPEGDMGRKVAHLVAGRMRDYIELEQGFSLAETLPPDDILGISLAESGMRERYGVTVVCVKKKDMPYTYAGYDTVLDEGDLILVAGNDSEVEKFAVLTHNVDEN